MATKASTIGLAQKFTQLINLEAAGVQLEADIKQLKKTAPKNLESPLTLADAETLILHHKEVKKSRLELKENEKAIKEAKSVLEELLKVLDGKDVLIPANGVNYLLSFSNGKLKYRMVFIAAEQQEKV
ncbi:MAG: hypothetical protein H7Y07_11505 [Pyrinomonadaceae bacterium]|nr:hypothetical protein [Sphingobacteriaceae bacterium]